MNERMKSIFSNGNVALITGAQQGIGAEFARQLAARGLKLALVDRDAAKLNALAESIGQDIMIAVGDVTDSEFVTALRDDISARLGPLSLLVNNAGVKQKAGPFDEPERWRHMLDVNLWAALRLQSLFVPDIIASERSAAIINVGSKEGITTPPGHAGYSVSKAGLKVLTEQLEHELRQVTGGRVSAHLLVPGYVWTPMSFPGMSDEDHKPTAPWSPAELLDYALPRILDGDFYIVCPDNEVCEVLDAKRIRWAWDDIIENRPALSRWQAEWAAKFKLWVEKDLGR